MYSAISRPIPPLPLPFSPSTPISGDFISGWHVRQGVWLWIDTSECLKVLPGAFYHHFFFKMASADSRLLPVGNVCVEFVIERESTQHTHIVHRQEKVKIHKAATPHHFSPHCSGPHRSAQNLTEASGSEHGNNIN